MSLIERILRGKTCTKQSSESTSTPQSDDNELISAIAEDPSIPEENQEEAIGIAKQLMEQDTHASNGALTVPMAVAGVAAYFALQSNEANAGITGQLVNRFIGMLSPELSKSFTEMFNGMLPGWFDSLQGSSNANASAMTSLADGVNHVKLTTFNQEVQVAAAPDPQQCELDSTCDDEMAAAASESVRRINTTIALDMSSQATDKNDRGNDFKEQMQRAEAANNPTAMINTDILYSNQGYDTEDDAERAFDVAKNISGADKSAITRARTDTARMAGASTMADRLDAERATSMARRSIANYVIASQTARRDNRSVNSGYRRSSARIESDEVARTHVGTSTHAGANAGYREQSREFVHPAPLMRQLNFSQARTNSLLLQELEELKMNNIVTGIQIMELIDRRGAI